MADANGLNKKDFFSLRSTLEWLKNENLLIETDKEVDPDLEITYGWWSANLI